MQIAGKRELRLYWFFFRSTLTITLIVALAVAFLRYAVASDHAVMMLFNLYAGSLPIGLLMDYLYKELSFKEQYYFFYNRGMGKLRLWVAVALIYLLFYFLFKGLLMLWIAV